MHQRGRMELMAHGTMTDNEESPPERPAAYNMIARWRGKWHMPRSKIQDRNELPAADLREKVLLTSCPASTVTACDHKSGEMLFHLWCWHAQLWNIGLFCRTFFYNHGFSLLSQRGRAFRTQYEVRCVVMNTKAAIHCRTPFLKSSMRHVWSFCEASDFQAIASWQWFKSTLQRVPADLQALRMNLEWTSCRLFYEAAPGIVGGEPIATSAWKGFVTQQVTRKPNSLE